MKSLETIDLFGLDGGAWSREWAYWEAMRMSIEGIERSDEAQARIVLVSKAWGK